MDLAIKSVTLKKVKETTSFEVVNALLEEGWSLRETGYHDGVFYYLLAFYA